MLFLLLVQHLTGATTHSYFEVLTHLSLSQWIANLQKHLIYLSKTTFILFFPSKTTITNCIFYLLNYFKNIIIYLLPLAIIIPLIYKTLKRSISILDFYFFLYLCTIIIWHIEAGGRYLLPIIGLILLFLIEWLIFIKNKIFQQINSSRKIPFSHQSSNITIKILLLFIILHNVISISLNYTFDNDVINKPETKEMVKWIQNNTIPSDHLMFDKPRVIGLLTKRKTAALLNYSTDRNLIERIQKFKINYMIFKKPNQKMSFETFNNPSLSIQILAQPNIIQSNQNSSDLLKTFNLTNILEPIPIWENEKFSIYEVKKM